jgi:CBS domain containing-hemolysin-like protein
MKVVMRALEGDWLAKLLIRLINMPTLLVATLLIGNNIANYLISLGLIVVTKALVQSDNAAVELIATFVSTPAVFVFGESLPKYVMYQSPTFVMRFAALPLMAMTVLFAPASGILWGLSRITEKFLGQSPEKVGLALARKELNQVLDEGQQVGILHPSQRQLSQNYFVIATQPVRQYYTPYSKSHAVPFGKSLAVVIRLAQRNQWSEIPVTNAAGTDLVGYVRLIDLLVDPRSNGKLESYSPLLDIRPDMPVGEALILLQTRRETMARVVNSSGQTLGLVTIDQLTDPLLKGPLGTLRR